MLIDAYDSLQILFNNAMCDGKKSIMIIHQMIMAMRVELIKY